MRAGWSCARRAKRACSSCRWIPAFGDFPVCAGGAGQPAGENHPDWRRAAHFFGWTAAQMRDVTRRTGARASNWSMGAKITIDSRP